MEKTNLYGESNWVDYDEVGLLSELMGSSSEQAEVIDRSKPLTMDDVVVTEDGRTLAEMLPSARNRSANLIKRVKSESIKDEKKVDLSMKFLQRNAEFTEQEKVIMKNLGLTSNVLSEKMRSDKLTRSQKEEIIGLGRYGPEKHFKGRRYRTSVGDSAILEFLAKFKFANTKILRWIRDEPQGRAWRKLNRLRNSGMVESKTIIGVPDLWGTTNPGMALSGYTLKPGLKPMPKISTISYDMSTNYIAACLWFNTVDVLNLEDFPANNRVIPLQEDGRTRVRGEMLVSELEIRSSIGFEISPASSTLRPSEGQSLYDTLSESQRNSLVESSYYGTSHEFELGNEYMYALYPVSGLTTSYHVPNLVVRRERGPNGEPRSIAVEIERETKSTDRYEETMLAYKLDDSIYSEVVYITQNSRVARRIEKAADLVGLENYRILPFITKDGTYEKSDIWMI